MTKLKLKFVNNKKPFVLPNWTVKKHKTVLEQISKMPKTATEDDRDTEFQILCIYESLKEIDSDVDLEKIRVLHPATHIELFNVVYNEGKVDIYFRDKGKKVKSN